MGLHTKVRVDDLLGVCSFLSEKDKQGEMYFSSEKGSNPGSFTGPGIFTALGLGELFDAWDAGTEEYVTWLESVARDTATEINAGESGVSIGLNSIFKNVLCFENGVEGFSDTTVIAQLITDLKRSLLVCTPYTDYAEERWSGDMSSITNRAGSPDTTMTVIDDISIGGTAIFDVVDSETDGFRIINGLQNYLTNINASDPANPTDDFPSEESFYAFLDSLPASSTQASTIVCHLLARDITGHVGKTVPRYVESLKNIDLGYTGIDVGVEEYANYTISSALSQVLGQFNTSTPPRVSSLMSTTLVATANLGGTDLSDGRNIILPLETRCDDSNGLDPEQFQPGLEYIKEMLIYSSTDESMDVTAIDDNISKNHRYWFI